MKLKVALEVARGTDLSIHKMGYACSVEDMRHRALDALLVAWEQVHLFANSNGEYHPVAILMEEMENK